MRTIPVSDAPFTPETKYVLRAAGGQQHSPQLYYTGKAGQDWVSPDLTQAFQYYSLNLARTRAKQHNAYTSLHDLHFVVLALID